MVSLISKTSVLIVLALTSAMAQSTPSAKPANQGSRGRDATSGGRQRSTSVLPEKEVTAPEPTPIPAMAPEELPPRPPRVSYRDGQLLVDSDNATLAEVLKAICRETGAQIEEPPNAANERVAAHLSGPPRRVIERLLDDGKFGYIILSPLQDQTGVQRVVLTGQTSSPMTSAAAQTAGRRAAAMPHAEPSPDPPPAAEMQPSAQPLPSSAQSSTVADAAAPGDQVKPIPGGGEPQRSDDAMQTPQNPDSSQQQQAKTPMQVLQDLYRRRQELQPQNQAQRTRAQ